MSHLLQKLKQPYHFLFAIAAYWWYGRPSRKLIIIGVTGTKGKSTTCRLIASVLEAGGYNVGLLSTVEFQIGKKRWLNTKKMTMLGRGQIHRMLKQMVRAGCQYAVVETASEGILQYRHVGLNYDIAVFTNLGTEHQERHGGFENLRRDKGKMFAALTSKAPKIVRGKKIPSVLIVNADDAQSAFYLAYMADSKYAYTLHNAAVAEKNVQLVSGSIQEVLKTGSYFSVGHNKYHLNIIGSFNVYNALAAVIVGESQGIAAEQIAQGLESVQSVEGRMEFIEAGQPFKVVVDYAHESISLTALFTTIRQMVSDNGGKVIAVVGSDGGGRDKSKRARMGEISGTLCDYVVISDVNCFDEDPKEIAEMLAVGARKAGKRDGVDMFIEVDRRLGIKKALELAGPHDIVAITAKGTEPCIVVARGKKIPWDDREVARELIRELKNNNVLRT